MDHRQLVATMRRLAIEAGDLIMDVYRKADFTVESKADESPVTEADRRADDHISAGLTGLGLPVVTEERVESHDIAADSFLIVDPLDGTKEFIKRRGDFTVNIALVERGVPVLGTVFAPARKRLFYTDGHGGAVEETGDFDPDVAGPAHPIRVAEPDNGALRVVASKSHRDAETDAYIARYAVAEAKSAGSSLKFALVATGEADLYPRLGPTMEWDTAAGDAVLRAAGGRVVDIGTERDFRYGKPGFKNGYFVAFAPGVELQTD